MEGVSWTELVLAVGPVGAVALGVVWIVAKNGFLKVVLRDDSGVDDVSALKKQVDDHNVRLSILEDRWDRQK